MKFAGKKVKTVPLIAALVFIGIAAFGFYKAYVGARHADNVMVAPTDLAAYTYVTKNDLKAQPVPVGSITDNDLTEDEYDSRYVIDGVDEGTVLTDSVLEGQRIDKRAVAEDPTESFAVVLPDERVVAATSTVTGAAIGTIRAGDVVDISADAGSVGLGSGASADYAKVICITIDPNGCEQVLPPGVRLSSDTKTSSDAAVSGNNQGTVQLLLAVDAADASSIAGQAVSLSLNPFCRVDRTGYFIKKPGCEPPSTRLASNPPVESSGTTDSISPQDLGAESTTSTTSTTTGTQG